METSDHTVIKPFCSEKLVHCESLPAPFWSAPEARTTRVSRQHPKPGDDLLWTIFLHWTETPAWNCFRLMPFPACFCRPPRLVNQSEPVISAPVLTVNYTS